MTPNSGFACCKAQAGLPSSLPHFARSSCLEVSLPHTADLALMETMGVVDGRGVEVLALRLLHHYQQRQAHPPAVVIFSDYDAKFQKPQLNCMHTIWRGLYRQSACCAAAFSNATVAPTPLEHSEAPYDALGQYYGFAHISHSCLILAWWQQRI